MNRWCGMGRLTRDSEMRYSKGDVAITTFSLAVDRKFKKEGQPDADFINCIAFAKTAEFINNYFHKGMRVAVTGRIQTSSWETEGKRQYKTEVVVEDTFFADSKQESKNGKTKFKPIEGGDYQSLPF